MIKKITIENFKGLRRASIPIKGLTLLTGPNSSGKSSFLQSLLLLRQGIDSPLYLNGENVSLGAPEDVIRRGSKELRYSFEYGGVSEIRKNHSLPEGKYTIHLTGEYNEPEQKNMLKVSGYRLKEKGLELKAETTKRAIEVTQKLGGLSPKCNAVEVLQEAKDNDGEAKFILVQGSAPTTLLARCSKWKLLDALRHYLDGTLESIVKIIQQDFKGDAKAFSETRQAISATFITFYFEDVGVLLNQLGFYIEESSSIKKVETHSLKKIGETGTPEAVFQSSSDLDEKIRKMSAKIDDTIDERLADLERRIPDFTYISIDAGSFTEPESVTRRSQTHYRILDALFQSGFCDRYAALFGATQEIKGFVKSLVYLGPIREAPRVTAMAGRGSSLSPIGAKGQYIASLLYETLGEKKFFPVPREATLINPDEPKGFMNLEGSKKLRIVNKKEDLVTATSEWVSYFAFAEKVQVGEAGKHGFRLQLEVGSRYLDLTALGVGVSQLLPVLVLILNAPRRSCVILEQPELHLHPRAQLALGTFLALARPDIRILCETHSEYLLTRLRRLLVEEKTQSLARAGWRPRHSLFDSISICYCFSSRKEKKGFVDLVLQIENKDKAGEESTITNVLSLPPSSDGSLIRELELDPSTGDIQEWPEDFFDSLRDETLRIVKLKRRGVSLK